MMASLRLTVCRASEVSGRLTRCDIRLIGSWVEKRQKRGAHLADIRYLDGNENNEKKNYLKQTTYELTQ